MPPDSRTRILKKQKTVSSNKKAVLRDGKERIQGSEQEWGEGTVFRGKIPERRISMKFGPGRIR